MPQPWERQPEETNKAWNAFRLYRDMDPSERSLAKVAKAAGYADISLPCRWSAKYDWVARAGSYDAHVDELNRARRERERLAASDRRIQLAKNMQLVGGSKIQDIGEKIQAALKKGEPLPAITLKEARMLIDTGVKIERLEHGEHTEQINVTRDPREMSDAELVELIRKKTQAEQDG